MTDSVPEAMQNAPKRFKLDRWTLIRWYPRFLWVMLIVMIYATIAFWFFGVAIRPINKELYYACKAQWSIFSVNFSVFAHALNPAMWGAPLDSYMNATFAPQVNSIATIACRTADPNFSISNTLAFNGLSFNTPS